MTTQTKHLLFWAAVIVLLFMFISEIRAILLPFVLGILLAYFLDPVVDRMVYRGISRSFATALVTILFFSVMALFLVTLIPLVGEQLVRLLHALPEYIRIVSEAYHRNIDPLLSRLPADNEQDIQSAITDISGNALGVTGKLISNLFASGAVVFNIISLLLISPIVTFYLLRDWDNLMARIDHLLPRRHVEVIHSQIREIDETISGFVHGQLVVCSTLALFYVIGFVLAGLNFGVALGALTGFLIIIPYLGWAAGATVAMIVAFMQYDSMTMVGIIGGILLAGQVLEGYFLTPKLIGDRVGLHPLWLIFGMLAGGALFGFVGVVIAVPATAIIGVLIRFAIRQYLASSLYQGK